VRHDELQKTLSEFAAERVALLQRHEAAARAVSNYDFNNTYQYVVSREETHLTWLRDALVELGGTLPAASSTLAVPRESKAILEDDARQLHAFVEKWRSRVAELSHARHSIMLNVILGESLEHGRLFEQAASGFEDLLGKRTGGVARVGGVLPTRWVE
jgi:hypothetical protein